MRATSSVSTLFSVMRSAAAATRSSAPMRIASTWPSRSQALRTGKVTRRGARLWQEIRPHSSPSIRMEIDMDAPVPMLRMYSRCTGETWRSPTSDRSSASPVSGSAAGSIWLGV